MYVSTDIYVCVHLFMVLILLWIFLLIHNIHIYSSSIYHHYHPNPTYVSRTRLNVCSWDTFWKILSRKKGPSSMLRECSHGVDMAYRGNEWGTVNTAAMERLRPTTFSCKHQALCPSHADTPGWDRACPISYLPFFFFVLLAFGLRILYLLGKALPLEPHPSSTTLRLVIMMFVNTRGSMPVKWAHAVCLEL
jgi:hypothetical protein